MDPDPHRSPTERLLLHLLVVRCQTGDEKAFARLLDRFGPRTLRYLQRLVGDEAEDVHQEVWLDVYRRIGQLATPAAFVTWLFTITRHRAIDFLRRRRRMHELLEDVAAERLVHGDVAIDAGSAELDGLDGAGAEELSAAIAALPSLHREVLLLRYQEELSYLEIAAVVGCSIGTVRSRLHHARRRLHEAIAPE
jgi:RNA polymerase sigma-70 factor (ECF subfamily)